MTQKIFDTDSEEDMALLWSILPEGIERISSTTNEYNTLWIKSGYEKAKKPTIDRINNKKGYEKDNIHLLPWSENRFKQTMERRCRKGRVLQKLNGVLINIWRSQRDVVKTLGLSQPMLSGVLNGKYKKAYGFEWEYENNIHENADLLEVGGK